MSRFVAYYRVSTEKQGRSGLGLEAQRAAVRAYVKGEPAQEFVEIESGANNARPQLAAALKACRLSRSVLVVAKLDRLGRNLAFLAALMDSGVEFIACDNPNANRLTLHILAALAEHERALISARTKDALAAAKARGVKLGGKRHEVEAFAAKAAQAAAAQRAAQNAESWRALREAIEDARAAIGADASLRKLAAELNARGVLSPLGAAVTPATLSRAMKAAA